MCARLTQSYYRYYEFEEEELVMPTVAVTMNGFSCSPSSVREGGEFIFALIFSPLFLKHFVSKKLRL